MKWNIVADSSCDLLEIENLSKDAEYNIVPLKIIIGEKEFVDDKSLDMNCFYHELETTKQKSSSSCPSVYEWEQEFLKAENSIAITISSGMSGSYESAIIAKKTVLEKFPDKKIFILDSLSAGVELVLIVKKINELISNGSSFSEIQEKIVQYSKETNLLCVISCFDNFVNNGRLNKIVGALLSKLKMCAVGKADEKGKLKIVSKVFGINKGLSNIISHMQEKGYNGKEVAIGHYSNLEGAIGLKDKIVNIWKNAVVSILPMRALCSYYAEKKGILIAYCV
ncbi:MAG: DegV family protein [Clostridia bacterium]